MITEIMLHHFVEPFDSIAVVLVVLVSVSFLEAFDVTEASLNLLRLGVAGRPVFMFMFFLRRLVANISERSRTFLTLDRKSFGRQLRM
jgi:hypothetical protein